MASLELYRNKLLVQNGNGYTFPSCCKYSMITLCGLYRQVILSVIIVVIRMCFTKIINVIIIYSVL